jgi:spore maturation protein CgeB
MKAHYRFLIGQHAATRLTMDSSFQCYDLMISSFPPTVDFFRRRGFLAALNRLGFDSRILARLRPTQQKFDVALVGSFADVHSSRVALLNELYAKLPRPETIKVWAPTVGHLPVESPIRRHYMGPAWGYHMYEILNDSKMTLNHHGDVLPYANNMRLFESTGTGTLLITDWKENLYEMFESGKEVVTYRTPEECAEKIQHYLTHEAERQTIASAGQARTLRDHTYQCRMQEFVGLVCRYI